MKVSPPGPVAVTPADGSSGAVTVTRAPDEETVVATSEPSAEMVVGASELAGARPKVTASLAAVSAWLATAAAPTGASAAELGPAWEQDRNCRHRHSDPAEEDWVLLRLFPRSSSRPEAGTVKLTEDQASI